MQSPWRAAGAGRASLDSAVGFAHPLLRVFSTPAATAKVERPMMLTDTGRPRVSRETRRLLAAAGLALLALWILARLRFPERPASPNPVAPVLTQISPPTTFAGLAQETARVEQRITPLLSVVSWQAPGEEHLRAYPAWRWRDDLAIAILPSASAVPASAEMRAVDPPTGLALVRVSRSEVPPGTIWTPDRLDVARYFFAASPAASRPAVAPVYVNSLEPQRSPAWSTEIWRVPTAGGLTAGTLVFTAAGDWLGIAANENGESVIVPAAALFDLATQLAQRQTPPGGELGFQVQHLDATLAAEIGVAAGSGVIVAWVDPRGRAAKALAIGDVIEAINGARTPTGFAWQVHSSRLGAGEKAALKVRRAGELHDITLTVPPPRSGRSTALGLTLVRAPGLGSRITQVAAHTAGDRAGLQAGDIVTMAGDDVEPPPTVVRRLFDDAPEGGAVVLAIRRGESRRLVVLTR